MTSSSDSPQRRRKKRDLSRDKIIDATLDALREDDPAGLKMRRVADLCGVSAMALYHHIDDKDELANAAVDSLFLTASQRPRIGDTWQEQATDLWRQIRAALLEIPGAGRIFVSRAIIGPGTALATEEMFCLLQKGGLTSMQIAETADAMTMLSIGSIANELTRPKQVRDLLGQQLPQETTPHLRDHLEIYSHRDGSQRYERALAKLLAGI